MPGLKIPPPFQKLTSALLRVHSVILLSIEYGKRETITSVSTGYGLSFLGVYGDGDVSLGKWKLLIHAGLLPWIHERIFRCGSKLRIRRAPVPSFPVELLIDRVADLLLILAG